MKDKIMSFESKFGEPIKFNSQFHMVKVYIAYAGKNRNFSIISEETFNKMLPSLYGIPIVGEWKQEKEDFGTHGGKIEISDEGIQYIDTTKPYGFVDSSATVEWEDVEEEDGTVNKYLTTTAFLWTSRYPEALKVLENQTNQSMEINVFDGKISEEFPEYFEILDGEFSALCMLGNDVVPAFESARISQFNMDKEDFKNEFLQMVAELRQSVNFASEGGENVEKELEEVVETVEEVVETEEVFEEVTDTDEVDKDETFEEEGTETDETEETEVEFTEEDVEPTEEPLEEEKFTKTFSLSHDDIRYKLYGLLAEVEENDDAWYWIDEVYDDYFVYSSNRYFKQGYVKTDVDVAFEGERVELFAEFLTAEELEELNKMRNEYQTLLDFKAEKDKEAFEAEQEEIRQTKIDHINSEYENITEDVKELFISKVDEYESVEDIDADICVYIVKNKVTFSQTKKKETVLTKVTVEDETSKPVPNPYGNLFN